jgi:hypothetical protein
MKPNRCIVAAVLLILSAGSLWAQQAGVCYVRLFDGAALAPTVEEAAALELAACRLIDSFPQGFRDSFVVFDYGFYLYAEVTAGLPPNFERAIAEAKAKAPYYLLFGRQSDRTGINTRFWVDLKLPSRAQFQCLDVVQRDELDQLVYEKSNELLKPNRLNSYQSTEMEVMEFLARSVVKITDCCYVQNRGSGDGCDLSFSDFPVVFNIYNGLKDWKTGVSYSGGQLASTKDGAVTVANLNDTDGDDPGNNDPEHGDSNDPVVESNTSIGRNEIDLMKIEIVKKPNISVTASLELSILSDRVRLWKEPVKKTQVVPVSGKIDIRPEDFAEGKVAFFVEAVLPSQELRDIKFQLIYKKPNASGQFDGLVRRATAVWVDFKKAWYADATEPIPGAAGELSNMKNEWLITRSIKNWISENKQVYGSGPCHADDYRINLDNPHPSAKELPGRNKQIGGRILFEFKVLPQGAETLVDFDCTRQKNVYRYRFVDGDAQPQALDRSGDFCYPFLCPDGAGRVRDIEMPNDDGNNNSDETWPPESGILYCNDYPSSRIHESEISNVSFKIEKIEFREYVRLSVKHPKNDVSDRDSYWKNQLRGSRCSKIVDWHCIYYLRRARDLISPGLLLYLADDKAVSVSDANKSVGFKGNGTIRIEAMAGAGTESYRLTFMDNKWVVKNASDVTNIFPTKSDGQSCDIVHNRISIKISKGDIPFVNNDTYSFSVFNSTAKKNLIALGKNNVEISSKP